VCRFVQPVWEGANLWRRTPLSRVRRFRPGLTWRGLGRQRWERAEVDPRGAEASRRAITTIDEGQTPESRAHRMFPVRAYAGSRLRSGQRVGRRDRVVADSVIPGIRHRKTDRTGPVA